MKEVMTIIRMLIAIIDIGWIVGYPIHRVKKKQKVFGDSKYVLVVCLFMMIINLLNLIPY